MQLIHKAAVVGVLWLGATRVMQGELTVGQLVAFNMLAGRVSGPILRLAQLWQDFQQARVSVDRLGDVLDTPPEPVGPAATVLPELRGALRFENVTFRYSPRGRPVLEDVDLAIEPGEVVGIIGPSGSGKSTLVKLAQRLYLPERGRVWIDGVDAALIRPASLRRQIGVVLQESWLFDGTLRENIAWSQPEMPLERVMQAAELAGAHEFVAELPQGYDTRVEERGMNLSGGQRQRVALARALATRPRLLILDEATSALDVETEQAIQERMGRICAGRTVLVVSHRLAALRPATRIVALEAGRIVEDGQPDELLTRNGPYSALFRHQLFDLPAMGAQG
ncbi:MAG: ATP-binding cassette domain-containing protein [Proteobacteria bacterium]|nr:ATP-binding cassette domain-containing protein [Pseudomonadota bacterium]